VWTGATICVAHGGVIRTLFQPDRQGIADEDAAMVDIPQDRVLKIEGNQIGWI
jgi:broad specificity phosphatase PhoE